MSVLASAVRNVSAPNVTGGESGWVVTMTDGWSLFAPAIRTIQAPTIGEPVVVVTSLPSGAGPMYGLVIGGRVYIDAVPVFDRAVPRAKLESVPPGTHVPDRVSDGAILDAVRAAVQALLEDRMVQTPFHAGVENRWRDLLAAVSMPAERVPPGTHLDSGAPSTPR